jgi:hypothetical protein
MEQDLGADIVSGREYYAATREVQILGSFALECLETSSQRVAGVVEVAVLGQGIGRLDSRDCQVDISTAGYQFSVARPLKKARVADGVPSKYGRIACAPAFFSAVSGATMLLTVTDKG